MFGPKVKIRSALYEKLKEAAAIIGCSSVEEFAERVLEAESTKVIAQRKKSAGSASEAEVQKIADKLKGLGYLE